MHASAPVQALTPSFSSFNAPAAACTRVAPRSPARPPRTRPPPRPAPPRPPRSGPRPRPAPAAAPSGPFPGASGRLRGGRSRTLSAAGGRMQADRGASGGRGRRPGRARPGGDRDRDRDRDRERAGAAAARGGGDSGGRRGRGRGFRGGRGGRGGGGRREPGGRGAGVRAPVEDDSDAETNGEENEEQGNYSKRKIVSNWDRYQDIEKEVNNESGESQRGTDFSVLLSSAGDSFSQFRFVEEKEWDGEVSGPKQNSAFYVDCESLVRALQELPLSLRLNVAAELVQTALPLELPQMKPKRNDEAKGLGMQLKGPLGPGGKGSISELKPATCCPAPSGGPQKPTAPLPSAADHLEEELDLLLSLDAPVREGESILPDLTPGLESERDGDVAQEGKGPAEPSVTDKKNVQSEQPSTSKPVTEEELEDWLDSMIS